MTANKLAYLGKTKASEENIWLYDFSWDCGWYWGGGYIGNKNMHSHFDSCFLDTVDSRGFHFGVTTVPNNNCYIWENLDFFLDNASFTAKEWWRMKDLFKQFYAYREAAECFRHGGNCTSDGRNENEINLDMASKINKHIEDVIIPEIRKLCADKRI